MTRRLPRLLFALASSGLVGTAAASQAGEAFTLAVIPDSQIQSLNDAWVMSLSDQARWIRENVTAENIALATHVGDVVQGEIAEGLFVSTIPAFAWDAQLQRTDAALSELDQANLDTVLPYSISSGNHDYLPVGDKNNAEDPISPTGFTSRYGPSRYTGYASQWYGGSDPTGFNHYQFFEGGGHSYLHLNLEYEPDNPDLDGDLDRGGFADAIAWAQSVIDANPGIPTIVSTHKYLTDDDGGNPDGFDDTGYQGDGFDDTFGGFRTDTGEAVWNALIRSNPQIFMTLNGHDHEGPYREDGEYAQVSYNDAGLPVYEILADYQDYANPLTGNDPYLRLIELDPAAGTITNKTFSPTFEAFQNDPLAIADRLDAVLDEFEAGVPVARYLGEDFIQIMLFEDIPGYEDFATQVTQLLDPEGELPFDFAITGSRADAEALILDFFELTDRSQLDKIDFSPYLTDADSQFTFAATFDASGRPVPEPASLVLVALGAMALAGSRRRAR